MDIFSLPKTDQLSLMRVGNSTSISAVFSVFNFSSSCSGTFECESGLTPPERPPNTFRQRRFQKKEGTKWKVDGLRWKLRGNITRRYILVPIPSFIV